MKRKSLQVSLHVREPSVVELTVGDRVQLDRAIPSPRGCIAERHGRLLEPGTTTVALEPGHYSFKTLSDAHLRVVTGGGTTIQSHSGKTLPPPPAIPDLRGDEVPGESPSLTIEGTQPRGEGTQPRGAVA